MSRQRTSKRFVLFTIAAVGMGLGPTLLPSITLAASASTLSQAGFEDNDASSGAATDNNALNAGAHQDWNTFSSDVQGDGTSANPNNWLGTPRYRYFGPLSSNDWQVAGLEDDAAVATDTGFSGGVKQDNDCAALSTGKAPNKDDLARVYMASKTMDVTVDTAGGGTATESHTFLELSWVRIPQNNTSASAHVGYEFNQGKTECGTQLNGMRMKLVQRKPGDMLVVYNFEGGSLAPQIKLSRWLFDANGNHSQDTGDFLPSGATCEVNTSSPVNGCWGYTRDLTAGGFAEGAVNFFNTKTKFASTDGLKPPTQSTNPANAEFGEAGIDLTGAGVFAAGTCNTFGRAYAVSRSSGNSSQAAMEDLVGPGKFDLSNCGSINVTKDGSDGDTAAQSGATFALYAGHDVDPTAAGPAPTVLDTCTVDDTGECVNDTTGDSPSFPSLHPGDYTVWESVPPSGYGFDTNGRGQNATVETDTTPVSVSFTDAAEPGSISITKTDDAGDAVNGAVFTAYTDAAETSTGVSCTTGDGTGAGGDGACAIVGLDPGTYYVDEVAPTGYFKDDSVTWPQQVTVTRDDTGTAASVSASNPRKFKTIVIVCKEADSTLYPSSVTVDGDTAGTSTSLSKADATAAGLSESKLCGITQGAEGGLRAAPDASNPHSAAIDIPNSQS